MTWQGFVVRAPKATGRSDDLRHRRQSAEARCVHAQTQVRDWIAQQHLQPWLMGEPGLVIDETTVDALRQTIDDTFTGAERRWAANFLSAGLERGKLELRWQVRVPPRVLALRIPSPPLHADIFPALTQVAAFDQALQAHWHACAQSQSAVPLEDVLLSAIWSSALISRERIHQVTTALHADTLHICPDGRWVWVEWQDDTGNWQRHVFDPLTALLALRWATASAGSGTTQTAQTETLTPALAPRLHHIVQRHSPSIGISTWTGFLRCAQAKWHYRLPPFLAQAARGLVANACLPPRAWWRVLLAQRLKLPDDADPAPKDQPTPRQRNRGVNSLRAATPTVRRVFQTAPPPRHQIVAALRRFMQTHAANRDDLDNVLAGWMVEALHPPGGSKGIRPSSAREMLSRIDRKLAAVLGTQLPTDAATWNDALEAIVQATGPRQRHNVAAALRSLDGYVRRRKAWEAPPPDLGADAGALVDAQLLTEREFGALLKALHQAASPRFCRAAAILGYRGGLRRTEIRGLRWVDLQFLPEPLLFVRSHAARALKRDSGRRVLPLAALCTPDEVALLRGIWSSMQRVVESGHADSQTALLLPSADDPSQPLPETALFDPVQAAMRAVCGDPHMRFHHLRHSAANRLLLGFMQDLIPGALSVLDAGAQPSAGTPSHGTARQALVGDAHAQRPLLWAVAAFMGHATPQTTLGSYVHLLDLLLGLAVRQAATPTSANVIAWLVGTTQGNVNVVHHRLGQTCAWPDRVAHWVKALRAQWANTQATDSPWPVERDDSATQQSPSESSHVQSTQDDKLLNFVEAQSLLAQTRRDPRAPYVLKSFSAERARQAQALMDRWARLRGRSLSRRRLAGLIDEPILAGDLRLERPQELRLLRVNEEQRVAQSLLNAWRHWEQRDASAVERALTLHWAARDSDDHAVTFTEPALAVAWKAMLDTLLEAKTIAPDNLHWQHQPSIRSALSAQDQLQHWCEALGIPADRISCGHPRAFPRTRAPFGLLRVADAQAGKGKQDGLMTALDAASYVMTLSILLRKHALKRAP